MLKEQRGFLHCKCRQIMDFMFVGVIFMLMISTATAIKCYVCGAGAEVPFVETKDLSINATHIRQTIQSSCEEFDRVDKKDRYAVDCPKDFVGCMLQIDEDDVVRTCSKYKIDDCKTANGIHYCYCNSFDYCNVANAESVKERLEVNVEKPSHRPMGSVSEPVEDDEDSAESSGMEDNSREDDSKEHHDDHQHRHHLTSTPRITVTVQNSITIAETTIKTIHNSAIKFHSTKTSFILFITFMSSIVFS